MLAITIVLAVIVFVAFLSEIVSSIYYERNFNAKSFLTKMNILRSNEIGMGKNCSPFSHLKKDRGKRKNLSCLLL